MTCCVMACYVSFIANKSSRIMEEFQDLNNFMHIFSCCPYKPELYGAYQDHYFKHHLKVLKGLKNSGYFPSAFLVRSYNIKE